MTEIDRASDEPSTIGEYLVALNAALEAGLSRRERILAEAEEHLREHATQLQAEGIGPEEAERTAIAYFGPVGAVAERFGSDAAGIIQHRLVGAGARLNGWRAEHPILGAFASPLVLFMLGFALLIGIAGQGLTGARGSMAFIPLLAMFGGLSLVCAIPAAVQAWIVRDRPEPGIRERQRAWAAEHHNAAGALAAAPTGLLAVAYLAWSVMRLDLPSLRFVAAMGGLAAMQFVGARRSATGTAFACSNGVCGVVPLPETRAVARFRQRYPKPWALLALVPMPLFFAVISGPKVLLVWVPLFPLMLFPVFGGRWHARWEIASLQHPVRAALGFGGVMAIAMLIGAWLQAGAFTAFIPWFVGPFSVLFTLLMVWAFVRAKRAKLDADLAARAVE